MNTTNPATSKAYKTAMAAIRRADRDLTRFGLTGGETSDEWIKIIGRADKAASRAWCQGVTGQDMEHVNAAVSALRGTLHAIVEQAYQARCKRRQMEIDRLRAEMRNSY